MGSCKWCNGRGWDSVEGGRRFACPDCDGRGWLPECEYCDEEYSGEYCERCYSDCSACGITTHIEEEWGGLCEDCFYMIEDLKKDINDDTIVCARCGTPVIDSVVKGLYVLLRRT